ncbi:MAG: tetratricopeptide repeat protein [Acidobacteriota bacterium]
MKKILLFIVLIMFTLVLSVSIAFAQRGRISGKVTDESGKPLPDVKITLLDLERGATFTIETDKKGEFFKSGLYPATYEITLELEGYYPIKDRLRLRAGAYEEMNITMAKLKPVVKGGEDFVNGLNFFKEHNYQAAIESFKKVTENYPDYPDAFYNLGISYLRSGDIDHATTSLQRAVELKPDTVAVYLGLGECYIKKDSMDKALEAFSEAEEIQPDNAKIHYNIGTIYYNEDKIDEAIAAFEKSAGLDPNFSSPHYQLGLAYFRKGELSKSIAHFEKFLELEPNAPEASQVKEFIEELKKQMTKPPKSKLIVTIANPRLCKLCEKEG